MKVMFLFQGLPHYYNYVLNRLNSVDGIEVINVVPSNPVNIGAGVFQTREDIQYKLYELQEYNTKYGGFFLQSLWKVIFKERPDIIVTSDKHLRGFIFNLPTFVIMKLFRIRLILKSIPIGVSKLEDTRRDLQNWLKEYMNKPSASVSWFSAKVFLPQGMVLDLLDKMAKRILNWIRWARGRARITVFFLERRLFWSLPHGHVNYVEEAFDIYGSYGIAREKIFITYNSPDTDRLLTAREKLLQEEINKQVKEHRLIHVGRLVEYKRLDLVLIALAELKKKYSDAELLVIGEGPKAVEWKDLAMILGIEKDVQFIGGVYDPFELGRYLMTSSVYVLAGFGGLSINDAMCFGLPIVCSICDGTEKHLVRNGFNGLFFREGDANDLHDKIDYLFTQPELRSQMGDNSLNIIRNEFNVHTVVRGYIRAFEYVTGRKIAPSVA